MDNSACYMDGFGDGVKYGRKKTIDEMADREAKIKAVMEYVLETHNDGRPCGICVCDMCQTARELLEVVK